MFSPIQDGSFWGCSRMGGGTKGSPVPKIFYTYPTMMKLGTVIPYIKKTQKIYESRDTPLEFCWYQRFFTRNLQVLLYQEIQIKIAFWYINSNSFNYFEFLNIVLIKMVSKMSAKIAALGLLKVKVFWNKVYDIIISVHDVTNKIFSCDSNYIVDMVM